MSFLIGYTYSSLTYNIPCLGHNTTPVQFNLINIDLLLIITCWIHEELCKLELSLIDCISIIKQLKFTIEGVKIQVPLKQGYLPRLRLRR